MKPILLILNLNKTLLYRPAPNRFGAYHPVMRPWLALFLAYVFRAGSPIVTFVWSSARLANVKILIDLCGLSPPATYTPAPYWDPSKPARRTDRAALDTKYRFASDNSDFGLSRATRSASWRPRQPVQTDELVSSIGGFSIETLNVGSAFNCQDHPSIQPSEPNSKLSTYRQSPRLGGLLHRGDIGFSKEDYMEATKAPAKDLTKVWLQDGFQHFDATNTVLLDDVGFDDVVQDDNLLQPEAFDVGQTPSVQESDVELLKMIAILERLSKAEVSDVRDHLNEGSYWSESTDKDLAEEGLKVARDLGLPGGKDKFDQNWWKHVEAPSEEASRAFA